MYYYNKDSDVRVDDCGETKIGKVKEYRPFINTITIQLLTGEVIKSTIDKVTRIL